MALVGRSGGEAELLSLAICHIRFYLLELWTQLLAPFNSISVNAGYVKENGNFVFRIEFSIKI